MYAGKEKIISSRKEPEENLENVSSSFETYSETSTEQLKIRNDLSDSNLSSEVAYHQLNYNYGYLKEDGLVLPSKLDILLNKKPICAEISSIKELSEDQGVYCLATGTSFTSHFSSVTNSHCVDSDQEINLSVYSSMDEKEKQTHLSLFEMTPVKAKIPLRKHLI